MLPGLVTTGHNPTWAPRPSTNIPGAVDSHNKHLSIGTLVQRACFHPVPLFTAQSARVIRHSRRTAHGKTIIWWGWWLCRHIQVLPGPEQWPLLLKNMAMMQLGPFCTSFFRSFTLGLHYSQGLIDLLGLFSRAYKGRCVHLFDYVPTMHVRYADFLCCFFAVLQPCRSQKARKAAVNHAGRCRP